MRFSPILEIQTFVINNLGALVTQTVNGSQLYLCGYNNDGIYILGYTDDTGWMILTPNDVILQSYPSYTYCSNNESRLLERMQRCQ